MACPKAWLAHAARRASRFVRRYGSRPKVRLVWRTVGALGLLALTWPTGGVSAGSGGAVRVVDALAAPVAGAWNQPPRRLDRTGPAAVPVSAWVPPIGTYVVQPGDTLTSIAERFGTDVASLAAVNHLDPNGILAVGERLTVLRGKGWLYTVRPGDTVDGIARRVGVRPAALEAANHLSGPNPILVPGMRLVVPGDPRTAAARPASRAARAAAVPAGPPLIWPVHGPITSPFGWRLNPWGGDQWFFHHGIDIGVPMDTPVVAACSGQVVLAAWDGGYGRAVEVQCDNGMLTLYAHNDRLVASQGEVVAQGQLIAYSGMTGNATGPHVHFGVMVGGVWKNPMQFLPPA